MPMHEDRHVVEATVKSPCLPSELLYNLSRLTAHKFGTGVSRKWALEQLHVFWGGGLALWHP